MFLKLEEDILIDNMGNKIIFFIKFYFSIKF